MNPPLSLPLGLLLCLGLIKSPALAQVTTGSIRGTIVDVQGAALPGVTVTARSPALVRGLVTVLTTQDGSFRIPALQPGAYELVAELEGFATATVPDVVVHLEQEVVLTITLQLVGVSETVTVTAAPPVIESTGVGLRARIETATIENIPLNGRQFLDLVQLVPGTAPRPPDVQDGAGATVLGGRSITNGFLIDGMQNRDNFTGGFKEFFIQDAIQEFNVNVAGFQPEFGLASGAVINIITKSGTNGLAGRGFIFLRDDSLDSSNVPGQPPPALQRIDVGGTLGGPIVKDKSWFFYALENLHETRGINLDLSRVPDIITSGFVSPAFDGNEPFDAEPVTRRFTQFGKVNQRLNAGHQLILSSNFNRNELDTFVRPSGGGGFISPPAGSISLPSTASDIRNPVFSVNGRESAFFGGNRWVLESTLRFVRDNFEENLDRGGGSADEISTLTFGPNGRFWNTNFPLVGAQKKLEKRLEWGEDLSYFGANHTFKAGFHYDRLSADGFFRAPVLNILGNTALESRYRELGMNLTSQASRTIPIPDGQREGYDIRDTIYSAYAQDSWEIASNFVVNGGIRWDYETLFEGANTNFAPRIGLTWDPWKDGRTVIRASGGLFYDAEILNPALRIQELGGMLFGGFSFWSMPRGGAFFNNPALGAFGPLQAGGTRFLANPLLFSYLMPAGARFASGGIEVIGRGEPNIVYELLGIPVPDPRTPPLLTVQTIPTLTNGRLTAQQALNVLNAFFVNPAGFPRFFFVPSEFSGQTIAEGTLAFKSGTENVFVTTIQSIERPFKTPYVASFNVGIERELWSGVSADLEYFRRKGHHLLARRVNNLRDQPISNTCIGNTVDRMPCNSQLQPIGFSDVHAATLAVRRRLANNYSFLFSYTYTHAIDNFNTLNTRGPANFTLNNEPDRDIGRSLNTPEHVMVLSGVYQAPWGVETSGVFRASTGRPFNAAGLPQDSDGDGNFDDRLLTTTKGEFSTDSIVELDLRLAKKFGSRTTRLTALVEVFNVFNRRNPLQVNRFFGPQIGETLEPMPGRELQVGVRVDF